MKKNNTKRYVFCVLTLIWMGVIFYFSAQNGEDSSKLSGGITEVVVRTLYSQFDSFSQEQKLSVLSNFSFYIRKGAHFTEYAILGFLATGCLTTYPWKRWQVGVLAYVFGTLYAVSDEFHQMFSDGRAPKLMDVAIDSSGVFFGILAFFILTYIYRKVKKNNR